MSISGNAASTQEVPSSDIQGRVTSEDKSQKSWVWPYYRITPNLSKGRQTASCVFCETLIGCSPSSGTNALKRHLERCKKSDFYKPSPKKRLKINESPPISVVAYREAPAAGRVTRQSSKMMQRGGSTVAKEMVLPGTDNAPSTLLDLSTVPTQSKSPLVMPLSCPDHDAERERSPEFPSQNENHNIHPVIPHIPLEDEDESSTVEGYEVRPEHVPVLRLIFAKYGDIAKNCDMQSPECLSHFLEMVCSIILELRRSNFREVTSFQLARMLEKIRDLEKEKFNVGWLRKKLEDIKEMKVLDDKYSELQEEKTKIERQKKLLESCEADLAALQDEVLLFHREVKEMTDKYEEGTQELSRMKHTIKDAYEEDLVDGLL